LMSLASQLAVWPHSPHWERWV